LYFIRYSIAIALGLLALIIIIANWLAILRYKKDKEKSFSLIPVVGGVLLCISFAIIPDNSYIWLCWIALILDVGCLPMVISALIYTMRHHQ
jgi:tellurite resistance protein TehA-like permease